MTKRTSCALPTTKLSPCHCLSNPPLNSYSSTAKHTPIPSQPTREPKWGFFLHQLIIRHHMCSHKCELRERLQCNVAEAMWSGLPTVQLACALWSCLCSIPPLLGTNSTLWAVSQKGYNSLLQMAWPHPRILDPCISILSLDFLKTLQCIVYHHWYPDNIGSDCGSSIRTTCTTA